MAHLFCLFPFSNIKKRIFKNLSTLFYLLLFSNIKKRILTNLKIPGTVFFGYSLFQILKREHLQILRQFFCLFPISNIKKAYLWVSKYLAHFFCLFRFSNIKKRIFTNPGTFSYLFSFSNIKKA